jgi:hypothetical protein
LFKYPFGIVSLLFSKSPRTRAAGLPPNHFFKALDVAPRFGVFEQQSERRRASGFLDNPFDVRQLDLSLFPSAYLCSAATSLSAATTERPASRRNFNFACFWLM